MRMINVKYFIFIIAVAVQLQVSYEQNQNKPYYEEFTFHTCCGISFSFVTVLLAVLNQHQQFLMSNPVQKINQNGIVQRTVNNAVA